MSRVPATDQALERFGEGRVLYSRPDVVDGGTTIFIPPSARVSESRRGRPPCT